MKFARLLVLVLVALAAFVGVHVVASSATELCSEPSEACKEAGVLAEGTTISAKLASETQGTFVTSAGTVSCKESTIKGKTTAEEEEPLPLEIETMSFSSCSLKGESCTLTALHLPYRGSLFAEEGGNGTIYMSELTETEKEEAAPGQKIVCGKLLSCSYTSWELPLSLTAGGPASIAAENVELRGSGEACAEATWSAEYRATAPNGGEFGAAQGDRNTTLCKANETPCNQRYTSPQALKGPSAVEIAITLRPSGLVINCEKSTLEAKTELEIGTPLKTQLTGFTFINCKTNTVPTKHNCTIKAEGTPYIQTRINAVGPPSAPAGNGSWQVHMRLGIECAGANIKACQYEQALALDIEGGNPAKVLFNTLSIDAKPGGTGCGERVLFGARYLLNEAPNNTLFVTG
jgi:hypothetical protein